MADFPLITWKDIDGREVPFTEPQHFDEHGKPKRTGEKNPLPIYDKSVSEGIDDLKKAVEEQGNKTSKVEVTNQKNVKFPADYPDEAVKKELESMKETQSKMQETQSEMIEALKKTNEGLQKTNDFLKDVIEDGAVNNRLTGSIAEKIKILYKQINLEVSSGSPDTTHIDVNGTHAFLSSVDKPFKIKEFRDKSIIIKNSGETDLKIDRVYAWIDGGYIGSEVISVEVPSGSVASLNTEELSEINYLYDALHFRINHHGKGASLDYWIVGGN